MKKLTTIALSGLLLGSSGCAPNRAQSMADAARRQVGQETSALGTVDQVRAGARAEATMLNDWSKSLQGTQYQGAIGSISIISSGLEQIAASTTNDEFAAAVLAMCDPVHVAIEPKVGALEIVIARRIQEGQLLSDKSAAERARVAELLTSFGQVMVSIPARCREANFHLQEASLIFGSSTNFFRRAIAL